jgi:hypothetical protein
MRKTCFLSFLLLSLIIKTTDSQFNRITNALIKGSSQLFGINYGGQEPTNTEPIQQYQQIDYYSTSNEDQRYQYNSISPSRSSACNEYFSYENGYFTTSGKISVPAWNPPKSVVKAVFTVATRITSVRFDITLLHIG